MCIIYEELPLSHGETKMLGTSKKSILEKVPEPY